jgi:hypothetical protein
MHHDQIVALRRRLGMSVLISGIDERDLSARERDRVVVEDQRVTDCVVAICKRQPPSRATRGACE